MPFPMHFNNGLRNCGIVLFLSARKLFIFKLNYNVSQYIGGLQNEANDFVCTSTSGLCGNMRWSARDALCHFHSNMVRATYPYQFHPHATLRSPIARIFMQFNMFLANATSYMQWLQQSLTRSCMSVYSIKSMVDYAMVWTLRGHVWAVRIPISLYFRINEFAQSLKKTYKRMEWCWQQFDFKNLCNTISNDCTLFQQVMVMVQVNANNMQFVYIYAFRTKQIWFCIL